MPALQAGRSFLSYPILSRLASLHSRWMDLKTSASRALICPVHDKPAVCSELQATIAGSNLRCLCMAGQHRFCVPRSRSNTMAQVPCRLCSISSRCYDIRLTARVLTTQAKSCDYCVLLASGNQRLLRSQSAVIAEACSSSLLIQSTACVSVSTLHCLDCCVIQSDSGFLCLSECWLAFCDHLSAGW